MIEEEVVSDAKTASGGMTSMMIAQLIMQFTLKGSIDEIWSFFLIVQLIAYMSIYETPIPANVEIYVSEFRKMIKFQVLSPDNILGLIKPGLTVQSIME